METVEQRLSVLPAESTQCVQEHLIESDCTVFLNVKCKNYVMLRPPYNDGNAMP
jgi:hypothetical protein